MDKELSELGVELIRCEECSYFHSIRTGKMGGVWGKCEIKNPALFVSERLYDGKPRRLGNAAIEKITKGITARAGVDKVGTVHVFRRTFATRMVERGMSIEAVQELMGHADPATTLKYYIAKAGLKVRAEWERCVA